MAALEAVLQQNKELNNTVLQMAKERNMPTVNAAPAPVDIGARAQLGGIETVVDASKQGFKMLGDAMTQLTQNQIKASDPHEQLKNTIEMAKLLTPPAPANNGMDAVVKMMELQLQQTREQAKQQLEQQEKSFTRLLDMQRESHKETVSMLTSRLDSLEKAKTESHTDPQVNALKTYKEIRAIVKDIEEDEAPPEENEPAWMKFGGKVLDGVGEFMRNAAAMRAAQPPPAPVVDVNPGLPQPPAAAPPTQQEQEMNMMQHYAKQIHKPLVDSIKAGQPGYDFAAAIISNAGQAAYDQLANGGYNGIARFLQCWQPLWNELILPPIGSVLLDKFIGEFLDKEKVMQALQMAKGQPPRKGPTVNQ